MIAGAGLALNVRSNRSSALNLSVSLFKHQHETVRLSLWVAQDQAAYPMGPLRFFARAGDLDDDFGESLTGDDTVHWIFASQHFMPIAIAELEAPAVFIDGAPQLLQRADAVHRKGRIVRPCDRLVSVYNDDTFGQPGDNLLELGSVSPLMGYVFGHRVTEQ